MTWGNIVKIQVECCKEYVNHYFGNNGRYNSLKEKEVYEKEE